MKKIRSNFVKESLLDYEKLANTLKENTSNAVRDLLAETVRSEYDKLLNEAEEDEDDYEVTEVEDTNTDTDTETDNAEDTNDNEGNFTEDGLDGEESSTEETEIESEPTEDGETSVEVSTQGTDEDGNEWAEFDKYKVSDDEYDFSNAEDDEIVRVYKLLKDTDQVCVSVDNNKLDLKDNETGAEYIIDLDTVDGVDATIEDDVDYEGDDIDADGNFEEDNNNMNESRIFEIALNEYDSHVGYTDNYQKKDVMTTPDMSEPGKNVNDWDAGVPKGKSKPWSSQKKSVAPFNGGKGKTVEEDIDMDEPMEECGEIEEANLSVSKWNDTHAVHNRVPAATDAQSRRSGSKKQSHGAEYYSDGIKESKAIIAKAEKILAENKKLKSALNKFRNVLQEASVTNVNLGQIIKLISENATTQSEKQDIIARFGKEAKTINESKALYEKISNELKKNSSPKANINEDRQFTANSSKMINESKIYQSEDLLASLDLMHRLCK